MDALLTPDWGRWALSLALALSLVQAGAGALGYGEVARRAAYGVFALSSASLFILIGAFLVSDFSLAIVAANSHTTKPLIYKIAGAWGNHEGSMVLWCMVLSGFAAAFAWRSGVSNALRDRAVCVLGALSAAFLAFTIFASSPFARLAEAPWEGRGFNPLLQDPAVALHPPMLYLGFVGLAAPFALAVAALWAPAQTMQGEQRAWARAQRRWALAAFATLTAGISLGSYWAYYELGWGGWWFWDPVENASLMPWLLAAALFHSALVTERRGLVAGWTALLAIMAFSLSIFGTFLTRSGVLTSVHAFAVDPARGAVLLGILAATMLPALTLFAWRAGALGQTGAPPRLLSREGFLILNNLFLVSTAAVVLTGTLWPLVVEGAGGPIISVGPPYFNAAALPVAGMAFIAAPVATLMVWGGGLAVRDRWAAAGLSGLAGLTGLGLLAAGGGFGPALGLALGAWLILGGGLHVWRMAAGEDSLQAGLRRLMLRPTQLGSPLAHAGVGLFAIGAAIGAAFPMERQGLLVEGESLQWSGGVAQLERVSKFDGPNYLADQALIRVTRSDGGIYEFTPERRVYLASDGITSEVAIRSRISGDLYLSLGPPQQRADGQVAWTVRVTEHPVIWMVFWGGALTSFGAALAFWGVAQTRRTARAGRDATPAAEPSGAEAGLGGALARERA